MMTKHKSQELSVVGSWVLSLRRTSPRKMSLCNQRYFKRSNLFTVYTTIFTLEHSNNTATPANGDITLTTTTHAEHSSWRHPLAKGHTPDDASAGVLLSLSLSHVTCLLLLLHSPSGLVLCDRVHAMYIQSRKISHLPDTHALSCNEHSR